MTTGGISPKEIYCMFRVPGCFSFLAYTIAGTITLSPFNNLIAYVRSKVIVSRANLREISG